MDGAAGTRRRYDPDLQDDEWTLIAPYLPGPKPGRRPRDADICAVVDAILLAAENGLSMASHPARLSSLGHGQLVLEPVARLGTLAGIERRLAAGFTRRCRTARRTVRRHDRQPVAEIRGNRGARGYDAGKKVVSRKRHILVDMMGWLLAACITPASVQRIATERNCCWPACGIGFHD